MYTPQPISPPPQYLQYAECPKAGIIINIDPLLPNRIPTGSSSKLSLGALRRTDTSAELSLNREDLLVACSLLCTADYCLETTQQLEAKLKEKIDSAFKEKIDFSQEEEHFRRCVFVCLYMRVCVCLRVCLCFAILYSSKFLRVKIFIKRPCFFNFMIKIS